MHVFVQLIQFEDDYDYDYDYDNSSYEECGLRWHHTTIQQKRNDLSLLTFI